MVQKILSSKKSKRIWGSKIKQARKLKKLQKNQKNYQTMLTGIFIDSTASSLTKKLKPSKRNELETQIFLFYLKNKLNYEVLGGFTWFDAGTHDPYYYIRI